MKNNDISINNVLYKASIEEELEWRTHENNSSDIALVDELLTEINNVGYKYVYYADILFRKHDEAIYKIILKYIGNFSDEGISAELVDVVGQKGNKFATETILTNYINSSEDNKHRQAVFYDNAIYRIKDKRYLSTYLELLKSETDAARLPLTMIMLAKWGCEEAKPYFVKYLNSNVFYINRNTSDLVFIAIEALSYYKNLNNDDLDELRKKSFSDDSDVANAVRKAGRRLAKWGIIL